MTDLASLIASSQIALRCSFVKKTEGENSMTFWLRRWIEQSRSYRCTTLPYLSPSTCTSTCLGSSRYFSMKIVPSPKALVDSLTAE